jgi:hypothetical protein
MDRDNEYIRETQIVFFSEILVFPTTLTCQINEPSIVSNWSLTEPNSFQIRQA